MDEQSAMEGAKAAAESTRAMADLVDSVKSTSPGAADLFFDMFGAYVDGDVVGMHVKRMLYSISFFTQWKSVVLQCFSEGSGQLQKSCFLFFHERSMHIV